MKKIILLFCFSTSLIFSMDVNNFIRCDFNSEDNPTYDLLKVLLEREIVLQDEIEFYKKLGANIGVALQIRDCIKSSNASKDIVTKFLEEECVDFACKGQVDFYYGAALRLLLKNKKFELYEKYFFKDLGADVESDYVKDVFEWFLYAYSICMCESTEQFLNTMLRDQVLPNRSRNGFPSKTNEYFIFLVDLLVAAGTGQNNINDVNNYWLERAMQFGNSTAVKALLEYGERVNDELILKSLIIYKREFVPCRSFMLMKGKYSKALEASLAADKEPLLEEMRICVRLMLQKLADSDVTAFATSVLAMTKEELYNFSITDDFHLLVSKRQKTFAALVLSLALTRQKYLNSKKRQIKN